MLFYPKPIPDRSPAMTAIQLGARRKIAASQFVILKERPLLPQMKDPNRQSRPIPLPPPIPIPDWRRFERYHSNSSQIGVGFRDLPSIGVGFEDVLPNTKSQIPKAFLLVASS